jgi:hypothetical protein
MLNPFRRESGKRKPPPPMTPKDMIRIYLMLAALIFVIVIMFVAWLLSKDKFDTGGEQQKPPQGETGETAPVAGTDVRLRPPGKLPVRADDREEPEENPPPPETEEEAPPPAPEPAPAPKPAPKPEPPPAPKEPPPPPVVPEKEQDPVEEETDEEVRPYDDLEKALEEFNVRDPRQPVVKESAGFVTLLTHFLQDVTPEEAKQKVVPGLQIRDLFDDADKHRGKYVRCYGRLIQIYSEYMNATTPTNTEVVYRGFMEIYGQTHPTPTVEFYLAELPVDSTTGEKIEFSTYQWEGQPLVRAHVEVEGMFLRPHTYRTIRKSAGGSEYNTSAVLFVKNLRLSKIAPPPDYRVGFILLVCGGAACLIFIVILAGVMSRRYSRGSIHMRMHEERLRRAREKGEGPFAKSSRGKQTLGDEVKKGDP